jgi:hypothetical protein
MTTKTEERIKKMLDDNLDERIKFFNERFSGVFLYGFIAGIIMSYSGFLGYFAGVGTGILISKKYQYISIQITEKASYLFQNVIDKAKNI